MTSAERRKLAACQNIADVKALLERTKKRGIAKPKGPDRKAEKRAEDAERLERLAEIRVELHRETGGMCVVCDFGLPFARMHAHHILSGPERQLEERQDTMAPVHERCHDWLHGKDARLDQREALVALLAWCDLTGRTMAAASTVRRIAKIDEARRVVAPAAEKEMT
jgi:hypothetical protein